jgi:hypothetical protein
VSVPQDDGYGVAWLAGFLEGEGSFSCVKTSAGHLTLQITFQSTDEDVSPVQRV